MTTKELTTDEVSEALKGLGISNVQHLGPTEMQRCAQDDVSFERFVGLKEGWQYMAHVCPVCRRVSVWNLDVSQPAEHFEF